MPGPARSLHLLLAGALLAAPGVAHGASSLAVGVGPPIAGAPTSVVFTMSSDDANARFAAARARVDDGRPCPATFFDVEALPGNVALGQARYAAGTTTVAGPVLSLPGRYRICSYLYGPTATTTLAAQDQVADVRLPAGALAMAITPPSPRYGDPVDVRITGSTDVAARLTLTEGTTPCTAEDRDSLGAPPIVPAGAIDVTVPQVELREDTTLLCAELAPERALAAPHAELVLARSELPVAQDLGGAMDDVRIRLEGRTIIATARLSGSFRGTPSMGGVDALCRAVVTVRKGRLTALCHIAADDRLPASVQVTLGGQTTRGAFVRSAPVAVSLAPWRRTARLIVPGRSIGVVRLGMPLAELRVQGGAPGGTHFSPGSLTLPGARAGRRQIWNVDGIDVRVVRGRVAGMLVRDDGFRTARGLGPGTVGRVARVRRLAPGASCRTRGRSIVTVCRVGRSTWFGPGRASKLGGGFVAVWPGAVVRPR